MPGESKHGTRQDAQARSKRRIDRPLLMSRRLSVRQAFRELSNG